MDLSIFILPLPFLWFIFALPSVDLTFSFFELVFILVVSPCMGMPCAKAGATVPTKKAERTAVNSAFFMTNVEREE